MLFPPQNETYCATEHLLKGHEWQPKLVPILLESTTNLKEKEETKIPRSKMPTNNWERDGGEGQEMEKNPKKRGRKQGEDSWTLRART